MESAYKSVLGFLGIKNGNNQGNNINNENNDNDNDIDLDNPYFNQNRI